MPRTSVITWVHESDLERCCKQIKKATRALHKALEAMADQMEYLGYSDQKIEERLREEFFKSARQVLKEES